MPQSCLPLEQRSQRQLYEAIAFCHDRRKALALRHFLSIHKP